MAQYFIRVVEISLCTLKCWTIQELDSKIIYSQTNDCAVGAIGALEKCARIIHQVCSLATSQLAAIDVDGLAPQQMNEFLLSSVEKFVGPMDIQRANSILRL